VGQKTYADAATSGLDQSDNRFIISVKKVGVGRSHGLRRQREDSSVVIEGSKKQACK